MFTHLIVLGDGFIGALHRPEGLGFLPQRMLHVPALGLPRGTRRRWVRGRGRAGTQHTTAQLEVHFTVGTTRPLFTEPSPATCWGTQWGKHSSDPAPDGVGHKGPPIPSNPAPLFTPDTERETAEEVQGLVSMLVTG